MSRFADLQAAVEENIARLKDCVSLLHGASKDAARKVNADASKFELDLNRDLRAMEAEARESVPSVRRSQQDTVASLRKEIGDTKIRLQKVNETLQRAELLPENRTAEVRVLPCHPMFMRVAFFIHAYCTGTHAHPRSSRILHCLPHGIRW
jgi:hypothetical protein